MAIPTDHDWREYAVYLRGPDGLNTFAFALCDSYRDGVWHEGRIASIPSSSESAPDDFGIQTAESFDVEIIDEADDSDWFLLDENGDLIVLEDGSGNIILEY